MFSRRLEPIIASCGNVQLKVLADLHDRGKLTDDEFGAEKARLADQPQPAGVAS